MCVRQGMARFRFTRNDSAEQKIDAAVSVSVSPVQPQRPQMPILLFADSLSLDLAQPSFSTKWVSNESGVP